MPYYVKKPVKVWAQQSSISGEINTLEGVMKYHAGDYIVTGVKGEMYPVRKDIFEDTYEETQ